MDARRGHEKVQRDAQQQPQSEQRQRSDLHRQQDDERDADQRMDVHADTDPAEQEDLQDHHYDEKNRVLQRAVHGFVAFL